MFAVDVKRLSSENGTRDGNGANAVLAQGDRIVKLIRNETLSKLHIRGGAGRDLILSPLETYELRRSRYDDLKEELDALTTRRLVMVAEAPSPAKPVFKAFVIAVPLLLPLFYVAMLFDTPWFWIAVGVAAVSVGAGFAWSAIRERDEIARWQVWPMLLVFLATAALPAAAMYFGTNIRDQIEEAGKPGVSLVDLTLVGRTFQLLFIALAAGLPAGLFFLFDRTKSDVLRERFERDIMRFEPSLTTAADVRARYGGIMGEVFGPDPMVTTPSSATGRISLRYGVTGRAAPIVVASLLMAIGWTVALLNPDVRQLLLATDVLLLFEPQRSPVVFAFLGAYSFALWHLYRGYTRSDLRPKTYTHVCVRILTAIVFGWVLEVMFFGKTAEAETGQMALLVLAFGVGFTPEWLLVLVQERLRAAGGTPETLAEPEPLTKLDGIDIYDRGRLLEEGVNNVEALAHHRLPELMLQTRIPAGRIVDWSDQAILVLHTEKASKDSGELRTLRLHGIRTATDLLQARAKHHDLDDPFHKILDQDEPDGTLRRVDLIAEAIEDEQWVVNLLSWHRMRHIHTATLAFCDGQLRRESDPARPARIATTAGEAPPTSGLSC